MANKFKPLTYFYYVRRYNNMTMEETVDLAADRGIKLSMATLRALEGGVRRPRKGTLLAWCDIWDGVEYRTAVKAVNGDIRISREDWKKLGISTNCLNHHFGRGRKKREGGKLI